MLKTQEEVPYPSSDILGTMLPMLLKKPWKPGCIQHFSILICLYIHICLICLLGDVYVSSPQPPPAKSQQTQQLGDHPGEKMLSRLPSITLQQSFATLLTLLAKLMIVCVLFGHVRSCKQLNNSWGTLLPWRKVEWLLRCSEAKRLTCSVKEAAIGWRRTSLNWTNASFCKYRLLLATWRSRKIQLNSSGSEIKKKLLRKKTSMAAGIILRIKCLNSVYVSVQTSSASINLFNSMLSGWLNDW